MGEAQGVRQIDTDRIISPEIWRARERRRCGGRDFCGTQLQCYILPALYTTRQLPAAHVSASINFAGAALLLFYAYTVRYVILRYLWGEKRKKRTQPTFLTRHPRHPFSEHHHPFLGVTFPIRNSRAALTLHQRLQHSTSVEGRCRSGSCFDPHIPFGFRSRKGLFLP